VECEGKVTLPTTPSPSPTVIAMSQKPPLTGIKVIGIVRNEWRTYDRASWLGSGALYGFAAFSGPADQSSGMLLADFGADVVRVDKPGPMLTPDVLCRRKRSLQLDLKEPSSKAVLEKLLRKADVLIDPFRPGVLESLDLDPRRLIRVNGKLIVAQLTGFRKDGSMMTRRI